MIIVRQYFTNVLYLTVVLLICSMGWSCNSHPKEAGMEVEVDLSSFQIQDGYRIEAVAAEPQVVAPVDAIFDEQGRLWVVEMIGYMTDYVGSLEDDPVGQISILSDLDGNGVMDDKKIFLDGLVMPRSIAFARGGLLYAVPPNLWWVPINDKDQPGKKVLVDSTYALGGNVEHQPNGLMYNIDNWYYNAKSNARYRYRNHKWEKEYIFPRGQWGISYDEDGRLYYNNNSNQFQGDYFIPGILDQNPNLVYPPGVSVNVVNDQSVYPLQFTPVNRGYVDGVLDSITQKLRHFTSASGPIYYTGHRYHGDFDGQGFACGPEVNLIKRNILTTDGVRISGEQYYKNEEFLISSDPAFRPVSLRIGPDGLIYILDMHRGIIQHKTYMTGYLKRQYEEFGLDTIDDLGRIFRILPADAPTESIPIIQSFDDPVNLLQHPNSWQRLYAQRIIIEENKRECIPALKELLRNKDAYYIPLHAFWTLEGLDAIQPAEILEFALRDHGRYLPHAVKYLTSNQTELFADVYTNILKNSLDLSEMTLIYLAAGTRYIADEVEDQVSYLRNILHNVGSDNRSFALYMALSQYPDEENQLLSSLKESYTHDPKFLGYLEEVEQKIQGTREYLARSAKRISRDDGLAIFESNCSTCHGKDGKGIEKLAPPLYQSPYLEDRDSALVMIALYGLQGPIEVGGKRYEFAGVMPGLSENTEYSDQEIAAVLSFIKNAFSMKPRSVSSRLVTAMRNYPPSDGQPFTVESLETHLRNISR